MPYAGQAPAGEDEYEAIADFLNKAAEAHENPEKMRNVLHFAGHGYNSDSMNARMDEGSALREQFPFLNEYGGSLTYIDHTFDDFVRDRLLTSLEDEELDLEEAEDEAEAFEDEEAAVEPEEDEDPVEV